MSPSDTTQRLLAFRSGDRCAFPGCPQNLTTEVKGGAGPTIIGEVAHIAGEKPSAARFDGSMSDEERCDYDNLIYLCPNHHTQIDKKPVPPAFSTVKLRRIKQKHEAKVRRCRDSAFADVGFAELARAVKWVSWTSPATDKSGFTVIPPEQKIKRNELSGRSRISIKMGLGAAKEVRAFVENEARVDVDFPERLRAGFLQEYYKQRRSGVRGDDLFDLMCAFSQQGLRSQAERSAALAILVYLFEACEVFEK